MLEGVEGHRGATDHPGAGRGGTDRADTHKSVSHIDMGPAVLAVRRMTGVLGHLQAAGERSGTTQGAATAATTAPPSFDILARGKQSQRLAGKVPLMLCLCRCV